MKLAPKAIRIGLVGLGLVAVAGAVYLHLANHRPPQPPPPIRPVKTVIARSVNEGEVIQQTGEIQPRTETALSFQMAGKLIHRPVEVGDTVKAGGVLAALDGTDAANELKGSEAELAGALSVENQASLANNRAAELLRISAISRAEAEAAEATYQAAVARRRSAQSLVEAARQKTRYATLTAREDGIITAVHANAGQVVSPGQTIVTVASLSEREAVFSVPEHLIQSGSPETPVEVFLTSDPKVKTTGRVREVSPAADPGTRTFRVRVSLPAPPDAMALGVVVQGRVILPSARAFRIPAASLTSIGDKAAVYVVQAGTATLERKPVIVGRFDKDFVSVTDGLNDGDIVVTAGVSKLRPGQSVRIEEGSAR